MELDHLLNVGVQKKIRKWRLLIYFSKKVIKEFKLVLNTRFSILKKALFRIITTRIYIGSVILFIVIIYFIVS